MTRTYQIVNEDSKRGGHLEERNSHGQKCGVMKTPFISPSTFPSKFAGLLWWGGIFLTPMSLSVPHPSPLQKALQANTLLTSLHLLSSHYPLVRAPCSIFSLGSMC